MDTKPEISAELAAQLQAALAELGVDAIRTTGENVGRQSRCLILTSVGDQRRFVLKVLNTDYRYNSPEALEREFDALQRFFHATTRSEEIGAAEPLRLFLNPPAYLMSFVEGVDLGTYLASHRPSADRIAILSDRIIQGVRIFHSCTSGLYGDFQPDNVLVDSELHISFIDPTTPNPAYAELERLDGWSPMSADLGYWTYSVSSRGFRQSLHSPLSVLRMMRLTTSLVDTAALENEESKRSDFVDSVFQAASFHVRRLREDTRRRSKTLATLTEGFLRLLRATVR